MLNASLAYLASDEALAQLDASNYRPKWHSPWWHMLLLHEMGETSRIPKRIIARFTATMNDLPARPARATGVGPRAAKIALPRPPPGLAPRRQPGRFA